MSSFTVPGKDSAGFTVTEGGFSDKGGLVEEWQVTLIVDDPTTWGALFALQTPKELVTNRACRGAPGTAPSITTDVGGGAGQGELVIDDHDTKQALLVDLSSDAPVTNGGQRVAKATFQIVPT